MRDESLIEFISSIDSIKSGQKLEKAKEILVPEFSLYHIEELTFEDESPRKKAFENVLSSLKFDGITFVYLLLGDRHGVSFYFGIAKDKNYDKPLELDVDKIGKSILKPSIEGNFRGSKIRRLTRNKKSMVKSNINGFNKFAKIEGLPSVNEDNEEFQGVDRLVDIMIGDEFGLIILADPLSNNQIKDIEERLYDIYNKLTPFSKKSLQNSYSKSETKGTNSGTNRSKTTGENDGKTTTETNGTNSGTSKGTSQSKSSGGTNDSTQSGGSEGSSEGQSYSLSEAKTEGISISNTIGSSNGENFSTQTSTSNSETLEFSNKNIEVWIEYIDEVLLSIVRYGKNKGLYYSNIYLLAKSKDILLKLGNTIQSLCSGTNENKAPLTYQYIEDKNEILSIKNFQFPKYGKKLSENEILTNLLLSKTLGSISGNWLSTNELSVVAGLPQKEVVGLTLKEEVEFGLNIKNNISQNSTLLLGNLVKSGHVLDIDVNLDKSNLDKHTFITGVTGSGKTTTCHKILNSSNIPFMVIEPAKTEYRILTKIKKDMLIFTLGNDNIAPFRLNPFEFFPHENITARVDMIKASIESAFDMEAAIPQIIESAIYKCYKSYGWNLSTNKNSKYTNPFADGVYAFPTLKDLIDMTEKVVEEQGFDERLKNDYVGSIKARLQGLMIGAKGAMLNTHRSIDFKELVKRDVILELEEIKNPSEKSLIMGFILTNLNEAIKANYEEYRAVGKRFRHITLIEEAHRLLSKYSAGDNPNKKLGVEVFSDMLAEVRKYGEALIIVDQIPNKLTPEVLKNTNTKIVHKLFAKDDKEAIGNTMALSNEQKEFLSNLEVGRAILTSQNLNKAIQVQVKELDELSTTDLEIIETSQLRKTALIYYQKEYKRGVIQGLESWNSRPTLKEIENFLEYTSSNQLIDGWCSICNNFSEEFTFDLKQHLIENHLTNNLDFLSKYICLKVYKNEKDLSIDDKITYLRSFLDEVLDGKVKFTMRDKNILRRIR
jgi:DNA helicase HerA-like ATPase